MMFRVFIKALAACLCCATPAKALDAELIAAAKDILTQAQVTSFLKGREYCGMIGRSSGGQLVITEARRGGKDSCRPKSLWKYYGMAEELASYHTHGRHNPRLDGEVPSLADLEADRSEGIVGFVATPGGRLWVTEPEQDRVRLICGPGCLPVDAHYNSFDAGEVRSSYTTKQLRERNKDMTQAYRSDG